MAKKTYEIHKALHPGYPVPDEEEFWTHNNRFDAPTSAPPDHDPGWKHPELVSFFMSRAAFTSIAIESISTADTAPFLDQPEHPKRAATIHLPGSDYAIPEWAAAFDPTIRKIVEQEHAVNSDADQQVAQIRFKQNRGQERGPVHPHMDMVNAGIQDYHVYLASNNTPTTGFEGEFSYAPYPGDARENPLALFRHLGAQFEAQLAQRLEDGSVVARTALPYEVIAVRALSVHKAPEEMPAGRTLFGIQFYKPPETDQAA